MVETGQFRDAEKYSNYLKTYSGRLRSELAWEYLRRFLPELTGTRVLDLGGGTGAVGLRMAAEGFQVVLLDSSEEMLGTARKNAEASGVTERISFFHADAGQLQELFEAEYFDTVVCHNLLEYVGDPAEMVRRISCVLRENGILSVLVRNRAGEVLKAAIRSGDCELAKSAISAETVVDSLYGQAVRIFDRVDLLQMVAGANLSVAGEYGVRVFSDYLDLADPDPEIYRQIFELECTLGSQPQFVAIARYLQIIARRASAAQVLET